MKNMVLFKNCFLFTLILFITFSGISVNAESEIPEIETEPLYVSDNSFYFGVFTAETKDEAKMVFFKMSQMKRYFMPPYRTQAKIAALL